MSGLNLVGPAATAPTHLVNRGDLNASLNSGVSRAWVQSEVASLASAYATKVSTSNTFSTYATQFYATTQAALLIPAAWLGQPTVTTPIPVTGIATTDANKLVPLAQMPNVGVGYVLGPYGLTATGSGGNTTATPLKIADVNIGPQALNFRPWCYANLLISGTTTGRPCVELRISNGAPTAYGTTTLVARGIARSLYGDYSAVSLVPIPDTTGESPGPLYGPQYNTWISMWLYDLNNQTATYVQSSFVSTAIYLIRNSQ